MSGYKWLLSSVAVTMLYAVEQCHATTQEASELLAKAENAVKWSKSALIKGTFRVTYQSLNVDGTYDSRSKTRTGTYSVARSGEQLQWSHVGDELNPDERVSHYLLRTASQRLFWNRDTVTLTTSTSFLPYFNSLDYGFPSVGSFLNGALSGNDQIALIDFQIVKEKGRLRLEVAAERIGDYDCLRLQIDGDTWTLKLWVVPERDYNFAKYEITSTRYGMNYQGEYRKAVGDIVYDKLPSGKWFIKSGTLSTWPEPSFVQPTSTERVTRTSVELDPDVDRLKLFVAPEIPDGQSVQFWESDGKDDKISTSAIQYIWKAGRPQPLHDPAIIQRIREEVRRIKRESQQPSSDGNSATTRPEK